MLSVFETVLAGRSCFDNGRILQVDRVSFPTEKTILVFSYTSGLATYQEPETWTLRAIRGIS
jgi:hypothetical protein